jgi:hypothetical protein
MSQVLLSEGFERAAARLSSTLENFRGIDCDRLERLVDRIEAQVTRMTEIAGMQAENSAQAESIPYVLGDFRKV